MTRAAEDMIFFLLLKESVPISAVFCHVLPKFIGE